MARGLSMFDANQRLVVCNKTYREIYALPKRLARPGTTLAQLVRHHVKQESGRDGSEESKKQREWIARHVAELARGKTFTHTQHLQSGRVILVTNQPLADGGWVDIQEDITERRKSTLRSVASRLRVLTSCALNAVRIIENHQQRRQAFACRATSHSRR
jgi:PAS domain-containing protein